MICTTWGRGKDKKRVTSFLNKRSGTQIIMTGNQLSRSSTFYTKISTMTIQIPGDFQEL